MVELLLNAGADPGSLGQVFNNRILSILIVLVALL